MSISSEQANKASCAFIFPGQGAQTVGMGLDLISSSSAAKEVFDQVDEALGVDISKIIFEGPEDDLRKTINAQPAILAMSLACLRAMEEFLGKENMPQPSLVAGHSLGQYTALVVSGALGLTVAARLVRERGRLMQYAAELTEGGMAAIIGMKDEDIDTICQETGTEVSNLNAPGQTVISGELKAVSQAIELAEARGARRAIPLPVAGAFHSKLMDPAQQGLNEAIEGIHLGDADIPIIANSTGLPIDDAQSIKRELVESLCSPVRWRESVAYMASSGINTFYEIGPGKALNGMVSRIQDGATIINVGDWDNVQSLAS